MKKSKKKSLKLKPGEWAYLKLRGHEMECCDCGLVHKMDFIVADMKGCILNNVQVVFRAYRKKK